MGVVDLNKAHWVPESNNKPLINHTIGDYFDQQVERFPEHRAVAFSSYENLNISEVNWTYSDFQSKVNEFAKALLEAGFQKGDHIGVWSVNIPDWLLLELACAKLGIVLVTMNPALRPQEIRYVLEKSDVSAVFVLSEFAKRNYVDELKALKKELPYFRDIYTFNDYKDEDVITCKKLLTGAKNIPNDALTAQQASVKPQDIFQIQFTSGTTGFPKAAMITHYNAVNNAYLTFHRWGISENDNFFSPLPLFHTAGSILAALGAVTVGATYITQPFFMQDDALKVMKYYKVSHFAGVPTMLQGVLNELEKQDERLDLELFVSGGAPVPKTLVERFEKNTNSKGVIMMGMTETGGIFSSSGPTDSVEKRHITSGQPLLHTEVKVVDPDTREIQACNDPGEIEVRGYMAMKGYYKMKAETTEMLSQDGWLKTGDIGQLDHEGYLNVVGRLKDMIIRGGENIYPREIEDFLMTHPKVTAAQVVGIPDEYYGEIAVAFLKVIEGEQMEESEIFIYCKGKISHQKTPARVKFIDSFPLTASGKIQKNVLRDQFQSPNID